MKQLCFIDLDGVLVDFVEGAFERHNITIEYPDIRWNFVKQAGIPESDFWSALSTGFWAGLKPTREFHGIIGAAECKFGQENIFLCSSPCETPGCIVGKALWVDTYLPMYSRRLILTSRKEVFSGPDRVLIDDADHNIDSWVKSGGIGILVPRPWNATKNVSRNVTAEVVQKIMALPESSHCNVCGATLAHNHTGWYCPFGSEHRQ